MAHPLQHQNIKHNPQHGFTLVELAIALMVIGLLIGGVLKGQELIENARITATIRQIKAYDAATLIFRNTYNALPGDIKRPNRIPNCTATLCNEPGDGNGKIGEQTDTVHELYNFFPHLSKAGMIQGVEGGVNITDNHDLFFPNTPLDVPISIMPSFGFSNGKYATGVTTNATAYELPSEFASYESGMPDIPVKVMLHLDTKIDDGKPHSGSMQTNPLGDCPTTGYANSSDENDYMTDDTNNSSCPIVIRTDF